MHDGIHVEKAGVPAVAVLTDRFVETGRAMARMWGAPDFPIIFTRHPIGNLSREELQERAAEMLDQVVSILTGVEASQLEATL